MLTVRITPVEGRATDVAGATRAAIARHPLARHLNGTVLIGTGSARLLQADDALPRVAVPLSLLHRTDNAARAQLARVDAIVCTDAHEAVDLMQVWVGNAPPVVVASTNAGTTAFLRGASARDSAEGWGAVAAHAELAASLARCTPNPSGAGDATAALAEAVIEAVVLAQAEHDGATPRRG